MTMTERKELTPFARDYEQVLRAGKPSALRKFAKRWNSRASGDVRTEIERLPVDLRKIEHERDAAVLGVVFWSLVLRTPRLSHMHGTASYELSKYADLSRGKASKALRKGIA